MHARRRWLSCGSAIGAGATTAIATATAPGGIVLYVDDDAPPGGDGSSWAAAYSSLQVALSDARAAAGLVTQILVGQGTYKYKPTDGLDRTATFELVDGVAIRGGFAGFGAPDPDAQDFHLYRTTWVPTSASPPRPHASTSSATRSLQPGRVVGASGP